MTKSEMIDELLRSPAWSGSKDKNFLMKNYTKEEIQDVYNELEQAEYEYYENLYN